MVCALCGINALISAGISLSLFLAPKIDSVSRAAALPVGATNFMLNGAALYNDCKIANSFVTVVVLPVPGPPVITLNPFVAAIAHATFANQCQYSDHQESSGLITEQVLHHQG